MFRNAEYVLALKELMQLQDSKSMEDYKRAFDRVDTDGSGYIDISEIQELLSDVYGGEVPDFEVKSFMRFFDANKDGHISWEEFQMGLTTMTEQQAAEAIAGAYEANTIQQSATATSAEKEKKRRNPTELDGM
mmetsp:Transcript_3687/g.8246  ORF Transcript_3687/g.8246 Transcript_3687/m.8246 type:complete len:133 (-) Transcript_3687:1220-1618(-)